jgi:cytochrome c553
MVDFSRGTVRILILACLAISPLAAQQASVPVQPEMATDLPAWAYGFDNTTEAPPPDSPDSEARGGPEKGELKHLPNSKMSFTLTQIRDNTGPADWYPDDHPKMPDIVAHGHKPVVACSFCHYPNGKGRPVNTNLTGLPYEYILHTLEDFKTGARRSADTRKANTNVMISFTRAMTDQEKKDAALYFSSMKYTPWIRVVETDRVPKTRIANGIFLRLPGTKTEPIGNRIVETPEDVEAMEVLRDDRSGFIAYVPTGSINKGAGLVMGGGGGKTIRCTICHGDDLMGLGPVPGLAGRSPSYLVRQLYDMKHGLRNGTWASLMNPVVTKLSTDDMLAIAAYLASLNVSTASGAAAPK